MNWKKIVKGVAPTLAAAFGTPLAGAATKVIMDGLFDDGEEHSDSDIFEMLQNPEGLAKLKEIDAKFKTDMKSLDIDLEKLAVEDRKDARSLAKDTSLLPQVVLSAVFIAGFFALLWVLLVSDIQLDESIKGIAFTLLGVVGTNVTLAMKFWFGGSPNDVENMRNIYNSIPSEKVKK